MPVSRVWSRSALAPAAGTHLGAGTEGGHFGQTRPTVRLQWVSVKRPLAGVAQVAAVAQVPTVRLPWVSVKRPLASLWLELHKLQQLQTLRREAAIRMAAHMGLR